MSTDISTQQQPVTEGGLQFDEPVIEPREGGDWSRRRAIVIGAIVGGIFGIIFFAAYGVTSAWICSSQFTCGRWPPIAITSAIGAVGFAVLGAAVAFTFRALYKLFKVA